MKLIWRGTYERHRRNFWCGLFGHHWVDGWYGDAPYLKIQHAGKDGIGRLHGSLHCECDRCGQSYLVARIHLNDTVILRALERDRNDP